MCTHTRPFEFKPQKALQSVAFHWDSAALIQFNIKLQQYTTKNFSKSQKLKKQPFVHSDLRLRLVKVKVG